jgi:hypothetical protein
MKRDRISIEQINKSAAKDRRERDKALSPEEKAQRKSNREYDREQRLRDKEEKEYQRNQKIKVKTELELLNYMLNNDTRYYHHKTFDSLKETIAETILWVKKSGNSLVRDSYVWNYYGEGNNFMSAALLHNLWDGGELFKTIYDVPLDGTYQFYVVDSGTRGLGSFDYMRCTKTVAIVPQVNPGGFPPTTYKP